MSTERDDDFGATLRQARESAGRTLRELADTTKLGIRTLDALERNQTDRLPPGIFRRSVVRAYAREVGLDPEATVKAFLARYPDHLPPPGVKTGPLADVVPPPVDRSAALWLGAAALIVIVLAASCWATRGSSEASRAPRSTSDAASVTSRR